MSEQVTNLSRRVFIGGAALFGTALVMNPNRAFAVSAAEKQAEADEVRNQLVSLQADLEKASNDYYAALEQQQAAQSSMEEQQTLIDQASSRIDELQTRVDSRAVSMYRTGPTGFLDFILGASSFSQLTQNWDILNQMNEDDARLVEETKTQKEALQTAKDEYARQEQIAADRAAEADQVQRTVSSRISEASALLESLDAETRELLEQEQAAAAAAAALEAAAAQQQSSSDSGASDSSSGAGSGTSGSGAGSQAVSNTPAPSYTAPSTPSYSGGGSASDNSAVVGYAMSRIGCPYVWAAEGPSSFDCSGLVVWAYRQIGMNLPHYTESLYACAKNVVPVSQARPGDVLYRYQHVGIAVGYGGVPYVHAPTFGAQVRDTDALSWSGFTAALQF